MKKIPTLFKRDFSQPGNPLTTEYNDGTEWVLAGEGIATRKYDGMAIKVHNQHAYKRYELKRGQIPPHDFEKVDHDPITGKTLGWVSIGWGSEDKWIREAILGGNPDKVVLSSGTYELLGPKVQGNPEKYHQHVLLAHDTAKVFTDVPTEFDTLKDWLTGRDIEGIVWHHSDGRMVKIKKSDFRMKR